MYWKVNILNLNTRNRFMRTLVFFDLPNIYNIDKKIIENFVNF